MIGCTDVEEIHAKVRELAANAPTTPVAEFHPPERIEVEEAVERVDAVGEDPMRIKLDKAGYFVVDIQDGEILVEHYSYKEKLLRIIEGEDARSIYLTIVRNGLGLQAGPCVLPRQGNWPRRSSASGMDSNTCRMAHSRAAQHITRTGLETQKT